MTATDPDGSKPTVVLVHGAWGDATGWDGVTRRLQADGYPVLAPANPLRGLASDAAYVASVLDTLPGPIVLVGHSYGGAVITNAATGKANVKALVYVAGFALEEGEDTVTAIGRHPGSLIVPPGLPGATTTGRPFPLPGGATSIDVYVNPDRFREIFVGDVSEETAAAMAAAQRPASVAILQDKSGAPAWKATPCWALVATQDNVIGTANVRFMAERAGATIVEVEASHAVHVSRPAEVADLIRTAAAAVAPGGA
jgi:pimeloyl-ACP methyl ester carboxylesterase